MPRRHAIIIGAMKCGTTSLFKALGAHPQIHPSRVKEPNFFTSEKKWRKGWKWYESLWDDTAISDESWALEASTAYTKIPKLPDAAERIAKTRADYRFIYLVRDPLARLESHYRHALLNDQSLAQQMDGAKIPSHMLAVSKYAMQLAAYTRRFALENVLLLSFEELRANPQKSVQRVCSFLEVDDSLRLSDAKVRYNPSTKDGATYKALKGLPLVNKLAHVVPLRYRQMVRNALAKPLPVDTTLTAAQRQYAARELSDDVRRLENEYGFDTSDWDLPLR